MTPTRQCHNLSPWHFSKGLLLLWTAVFVVGSLSQTFAQGWATSVTGEPDLNASAVVGGSAKLPCDITAPVNDTTQLVLWYKQDSVNPVYTLDLRDKKTSAAHQECISADTKNRTLFCSGEFMPYLYITDVYADDQGLYRCRVDFKRARSRNRHVNLNVVVPPRTPAILGEKGQDLESKIGPYNEGSSLFLSCEVVGGRPPPRVTWWRDSVLLDDSYEVTSLGIVRNDLKVESLSRNDFEASFTCQASNNNMTNAVSSSVTVDMNLKPLEITILDAKKSLKANQQYKLMCRTVGSRPPPIIAWWKEDVRLKRTEETMSDDKNITTSILMFTPTSDDNGKSIWCQAANPAIPNSNITDSWQLDIHYIPVLVLRPGESVNLDNVREGDDVYLECDIQSNPAALRVEWQFQSKILSHNASEGIVISNRSLVLQRVKPQNSGAYSCSATNTQGEGESKKLILQVKHPPFCQPNLKTVFRVARGETVKIPCEVEAYPSKVAFHWRSNRTTSDDGKRFEYTSEKTRSVLSFTPRSERDFGDLYCWGGNDVGFQKMPCIFTIEPAGPPDPVNNCSIINQTQTVISVDCMSGYDGGLVQSFICEVSELSAPEIKRSLSNSQPSFQISNLRPGMNYLIKIFASNHKGISKPFVLNSATLKSAVVDRNGAEKMLTTILGVVIGIVVALALIGITILIVMRLKTSTRSKRKNYQPNEHTDRSNVPLRKDMDDSLENEEKSPDIICSTNEQEFPSVKVRCLQKWAYGSEGPCENCLRHQGMSTFTGSHVGCISENIASCRYPLRKIQPYEDSTQPDIQIQAHHKFRIGENVDSGVCLPTSFSPGTLQPILNHADPEETPAKVGLGAINNRQESSV